MSSSLVEPMLKLIERKEVTVMQVLIEPSLGHCVRSPPQAFIKFVSDRCNLAMILDILLSNKFRKIVDFDKIEKGAKTVMTSPSSSLMEPILRKSAIREKINSFISSPDIKNPILCGNLSLILESLVRFTHGNFFKVMPNIMDWFLTNCYTLAIRELFSHFLIDYPQFFSITKEYAIKVSAAASNPTGWNVICAILLFLNSKPDNVVFFQQEKVVENLLIAGIAKETASSTIISIFTLLQRINSRGFSISENLIKKYSPLFFEAHPDVEDSVYISVIPILKTKDPKILNKIFLPQTGSRLKQSLLTLFEKFSNKELLELSNELNLPAKLIECVPKQRYNVHILYLAKILQKVVPFQQKWDDFSKEINFKLQLLDQPYGGKILNANEVSHPSSSSDDDDDFIDADLLEDGLPEGFGESVDAPHLHAFPVYGKVPHLSQFHA